MEKTLSFAPDLVDLIKNKEKILTYRLGNKYDYINIGETVKISNSLTDEVFGEVEVLDKKHTDFKSLLIDAAGHEKYLSKENQRKVFEGYYHKNIKDSDEFLVFKFRFIS